MLDLLASLHSSLHSQRTRISYQNNSRCTRADGNSLSRRLRASLLPILVALFAAAVLCTNAGAQVRFGSVVGSVADASGATVSGATIKLTNLGTNETRTMQSSSAGTYSFPNLIAGMYRVEVQTQGFKQFIQDNVEVQVDVATRVDAKLQVGNVTESVLVTTEAPPLQTDSASLGTTISQTEVESIPLSGRNVNNMLTLVPGVVAQGSTSGNLVSNQAGGARTNAIGFGNYAIGGGFGNQSSFFVDGVPANAPANNVNGFVPSQDVVQEFRVVTNNVSAEYGSYAGGVVNLTTKAGSNAFRGAGYEYLRNDALNATDFFTSRLGLTKPPMDQNQFGATLGGPVRKNHTFFFAGLEREVLHSATLVRNTVPTAAMRAGDFSAPGLAPIYDQSRPGNPQFQCNGVLNAICPDRLDPVAVRMLQQFYPLPNQSGLVNNFVTQQAIGGVNNQVNARVDQRISGNNMLFARYSYWKAESLAYDPWGLGTQGQGPTGVTTHQAV